MPFHSHARITPCRVSRRQRAAACLRPPAVRRRASCRLIDAATIHALFLLNYFHLRLSDTLHIIYHCRYAAAAVVFFVRV